MPRQTSVITCYFIAVAAAVVWTFWLARMIPNFIVPLGRNNYPVLQTSNLGSFSQAINSYQKDLGLKNCKVLPRQLSTIQKP